MPYDAPTPLSSPYEGAAPEIDDNDNDNDNDDDDDNDNNENDDDE